MEFRRLVFEQWEHRHGREFRLGIDDTTVIRARLEENRAFFFDPTGNSGRHFTLVANDSSRRLTFHETLECTQDFQGEQFKWNENGVAFVFNGAHIEYRWQSRHFQNRLETLVAQRCRWFRTPSELRAQGIVALVRTPSDADLHQVADSRWELDLGTVGPEPVEVLWRRPPGTLFLTVGVKLAIVGAAILSSEDDGILIRERDLAAIINEFMRAIAEPGSPWPLLK